ncbi:hypothetical protein QQF64_026189 [Cirrhinus molitorella]|uniref:ribonuclease H n=1 Tax=Cirrhinus molitorella TaxID=172907 RepID=A0ABR3NSD7_9TELE
MDDILVLWLYHEEHDHRLDEVLKAIHASGLKLKKEKCNFGQKELGFVGHCFSKEGISPNPEKVCAILDLSKPQNNTSHAEMCASFIVSEFVVMIAVLLLLDFFGC